MRSPNKRKVPGLVLLIGGVIVVAALLAIATSVLSRTMAPQTAACDAGQFCIDSNISAPVPVATPFEYRFTIVSETGTVFKNFGVNHEKLMHLFVLRLDTQFFQHVHPDYDPKTGTFAISLELPQEGTYRVFADFVPGNAGTSTSAVEDIVAGTTAFAPVALSPSSTFTQNGYEISLKADSERVIASDDVLLTFTIKKDGEPVVDIQPYLGEAGHVVIVREDNLDFVHTHPISQLSQTGQVIFHASLLQPGNYKVFAQFEHLGQVITSEFVLPIQR